MPLYEIHHSTPLSTPQRTTLAARITHLHCSTFSAPSAFVNVVFHTTSQSSSLSSATPSPTIFVGGHPAHTNYILGHLRPRPNNDKNLQHVVESIMSIWEECVQSDGAQLPSQPHSKAGTGGRLDDPLALHNVFLFEDIVAGAEQGFVLPRAGRDGEWVQSHMAEFERRAGEGDVSMRRLVGEYGGRL